MMGLSTFRSFDALPSALLPLSGHTGASVARSTYFAAGTPALAAVSPPEQVPKLEIGTYAWK